MTDAPDEFARLLAEARESPEALGRLLDGLRPYLLKAANAGIAGPLRSKASGSDLVQETFLEAHRIFARFGGRSRRELTAWLHAILVNKASELARHYAARKRQAGREVPLAGGPAEPPADAPSPSTHAIAAEGDAALRAALARLPDHYRQVIVWRQWDGLSFEEIAGRLGKGADAARMVWWRAVGRLQKEIQPE